MGANPYPTLSNREVEKLDLFVFIMVSLLQNCMWKQKWLNIFYLYCICNLKVDFQLQLDPLVELVYFYSKDKKENICLIPKEKYQ